MTLFLIIAIAMTFLGVVAACLCATVLAIDSGDKIMKILAAVVYALAIFAITIIAIESIMLFNAGG